MKKKVLSRFIFTFGAMFLIAILLPASVLAQAASPPADISSPDKLVQHLYDQVTFPAGKTPDWEHIRTLFIKDAVVVMRTGKNKTNTLSLDGWILDFVNFINDAEVKKTGFTEKIVRMKTMVFGDIAHVLVLYTSEIPGKTRIPQEGVDSFHLIRRDGKWLIVSILNEIPNAERPKPDALK